ncbi:metalloregulator ArsR/SmtB family transcription factor [Corynebacterium sp.]|uniref:metalloregulator ArsR/SmtB family transcription factor n=1 Tax=Corynebacterium sp. TaxID=1720 RepID=UPI0019AB9FE5|nr:metalloregulator ArsR/SmtB family transcription factor [Corynebacterium sp.]HHU68548.1 metalloregulator ArsR/SmtB family transcription factor [Corynebacterium sp.]
MPPQARDPRAFKDDVFGHIARIGAALGHAKRIEILDVLLQGERPVESLAQQVAASVANTSRHLQILAAAGLVARRAEGTSRVYRVADDQVAGVYLAVRGLARSHIADVSILAEAFFAEVDGVRAVTFEEFDELHRTGEALLVDVRPAAEFAAGHAEGAVNIPLADLDRRLAELPADRTIVAYCRGPYCVFAADAVTRLREAGLRAVRLEEGYPEWRESGRPVSP